MVPVRAKTLYIRGGAATGDLQATIGPEPFQAEWEWNGKRLTVKADRHGLQPVFYRHTDGFFAISSSIDALRQEGDAFDWSALGLFLRLGYYLDNDTPFRDIRLAPADSTLRWEDGTLTIEARQRPPLAPFSGSRQEAKDIYIELFRNGLRGLIESYPGLPISCPLSGGRDSRHIFLELVRLGVPFRAYTVALDNSDDALVAVALCEQYRVPYTTVPMGRSSIARSRSMESTTHYATIEHRWMTGMVAAIPHGIVFDGVAGDVLSEYAERLVGFSLFRKGAWEELTAELPKRDGKALKMLLQPWLFEKISGTEVKRRLISALSRHADSPNPLSAFYLANRTRRVTSLMATAVFGHCVGLMPYLLDPIYEFLSTLPGEMTAGSQLHSETISHAFPECKHPYASYRPRDTSKRYMAEGLLESRRWGHIANMDYLMPRLLRGSVDGAYSARSDWLINVVQYIHHIGVGRP